VVDVFGHPAGRDPLLADYDAVWWVERPRFADEFSGWCKRERSSGWRYNAASQEAVRLRAGRSRPRGEVAGVEFTTPAGFQVLDLAGVATQQVQSGELILLRR
jgi:hypothetical protein